jgi:hypothetical protein
MPTGSALTKWLKRAGILGGLALLAACAAPQQMAAVPPGPLPPGQARIWFYRVYDPSLSRNIANVDLNGARAVSVQPGDGPAYVDVAPGHYHIAPETYGVDFNQTRDVDVAAGQQVYAKILDDPQWITGGDFNELRRDTFYVWLMPPRIAQAEMGWPPT